jgi:LysR family hydrogen peroxide-inducible transcriptional activator
MLAHERLLLLEEGHCLRDQALSSCRLVTPEARESFGASSLATIVQMVAYGYGITRLPEWWWRAKCISGSTVAC